MLRVPFLLVLLCACPRTDTPKETGDSTVDTEAGSVDADGDGFTSDIDCNDTDAAIHPEARESCDEVDNDCDGLVDDDDPDVKGTTTWFMDADQDGFGTPQFTQEACLQPNGFADNSNDCNDLSASVHPDADEVCDGADNNCDGSVDEDDATDAYTWYYDSDGDGFGLDSETETACDPPRDHVAHGGDCDDADPSYNPGALEADCADPADYNCDGSVGYADADGDGFAACADCDDADANANEDAAEICDGIDNDCDGDIDSGDGNVQGASTWYADADGDGYGGSQFQAEACEAPPGYVNNTDDCDDLDAASHPGASEVCDDADNDCDGDIDEGVGSTWYADSDGDGYGDATTTTEACSVPPGYAANGDDCDDTSASAHPGSFEICDSLDNDCDGLTDEDAINAATWYLDADGDGYGVASSSTIACAQPSGYAGNSGDCDDADAAASPAVSETCDAVDNDCDGTIDEDDAIDAATWYADVDGDGYGSATSSTAACSQPSGFVSDATDCDDTAATTHTAGIEVCDFADNDCDGTIDEDDASDALTWYQDTDGDGYGDATSSTTSCVQPSGYAGNASDCDDSDATVSPSATETCDGTDNNCDGTADEGLAGSGAQCAVQSCQAIVDASASIGDGTYWIDPAGTGAIQVYCRMNDNGGGWTLVLRAGVGRNLVTPDLTGEYLPYPSAATDPGSNVLEKMSDAMINQIRTASGGDIAYWVTTPGSGTGLLGAENFHRGDCTFALHQTSDQVKSTSCHYSTINYSATPTWEAGGHWYDNSTGYLWAFGYANEGNHGTGPVCHQDGTGLGVHTPPHTAFHRGWCGTGDWGLVFVR